MSELSKLTLLVSCLYLLYLAVRLPLLYNENAGKHKILSAIAVSGLTALALLAIGLCLRLLYR